MDLSASFSRGASKLWVRAKPLLPAIHCPVLLVQADPSAGGVVTDDEVQRALTLLPDPTHMRFSGMDHMLIYDPKGPPMVAVNAFLSQLSL